MRIALSLGALARAEIGFFAPNSDRVDYKTAKTTCELYGADLSYFDNQAEYDQFLKFIDTGNENLWIGVSRSNSQTGWSTVTTKEYKFQSWARGEPNNADGRENCVEYSAWHKDWNDQDCSDKNRFICRVKSMKASCIDFTRVSNLAVDWNTAKLKCKEAGGALAYFDNSLEYDQYSRQMGLGNSNEWLGVHRSSRDGWSTVEGRKNMFFQWMTAAGKSRLGYGGSDEPNNWGGKEDCVEYRGIHKKWNNSPCQNKNKFACRFDTCPQGRIEFTTLLGHAKNAYEAELRCRKIGGHLPFFNNNQEWQLYLAAIGSFPRENWIGAQRIGSSDRFVNVDGSIAFLPWSSGEPNNANARDENCVEAWRNGDGVNDQNCYSGGRQYSCRIDSPRRCTDIEPNCGKNCYSGFSKLFCPKTCGTCDTWKPQIIGDLSYLDNWNAHNCRDLNRDCKVWAETNQCMVNPVYMLKNCPVSCHQCSV